MAAAFAVSTTLVEPFQTVLAARALGVSPMVFVHGVAGRVPGRGRNVRSSLLGVRLALVDAGVHEALRLVICTGVGVLAYAALCAWRVPELAQEVRGVLGRRGAARQRLAAPAAAVES